MLTRMTQAQWEENRGFFCELVKEQNRCTYPVCIDGIRTENDFLQETEAAFRQKDSVLLLYSQDGITRGMISCYVLPEDLYIGIRAFAVQAEFSRALREFWDWIAGLYPGYTLYLGLPGANRDAVEYCEANGFCLEEDSFVDVIHFDRYHAAEDFPGLIRITRDNFALYAVLHAQHDEDMYWNNQRLWEKLSDWFIYVYQKDGKSEAAICYTMQAGMLEIFSVDFPDGQFSEGPFRAVLTQALNDGKRAGARCLLYFNENDEHTVLLKMGFVFIGKYLLYTRTAPAG